MKFDEDTKKIMKTIFASKEKFHKERRKLPFEEKIRIVVQLQKLANEITKQKKHKRTSFPVWEIG